MSSSLPNLIYSSQPTPNYWSIITCYVEFLKLNSIKQESDALI